MTIRRSTNLRTLSLSEVNPKGRVASTSVHVGPEWVIFPRSGTGLCAVNVTLFSNVPACSPARGKSANSGCEQLQQGGRTQGPNRHRQDRALGAPQNGPRPIAMYRVDIDCSAVEEATGLPYASKKHTSLLPTHFECHHADQLDFREVRT